MTPKEIAKRERVLDAGLIACMEIERRIRAEKAALLAALAKVASGNQPKALGRIAKEGGGS